jgi:Flp pilus assembly pilin Flp
MRKSVQRFIEYGLITAGISVATIAVVQGLGVNLSAP